jgi:hypothetical protein
VDLKRALQWARLSEHHAEESEAVKAAKLARDKAAAELTYRDEELARLTTEKKNEYMDKLKSCDPGLTAERQALEKFYAMRQESGRRLYVLNCMIDSYLLNHRDIGTDCPDVIEDFTNQAERLNLLPLFINIKAKKQELTERAAETARIEKFNAKQAQAAEKAFEELPTLPEPEPVSEPVSVFLRERTPEDYLPVP